MPQDPVNLSNSPYAPLNQVGFGNVPAPVTRGIPTAPPVTTYGITLIPAFNKMNTSPLPTTKLVIRSLIRGNSA